MISDLLGFGHATISNQPTCEFSKSRINKMIAKRAKFFNVRFCRGMPEHIQIHRRSEEHGASGGKVDSEQKIVTNTARHLCQCVGARRSDYHRVSPKAKVNVVIPLA